MLILTRRVGETLMIGDEVTVTVLGVKGNRYVLVLTLLKKYLSTVKRSTSVSGLKNPSSPVTDIVASRCRARRNPSCYFSCLKLPFDFNRSVFNHSRQLISSKPHASLHRFLGGCLQNPLIKHSLCGFYMRIACDLCKR